MQTDHFLPKGAASYKLSFNGSPRVFCFVMLPRMTMLAFSAAIEPLRIANQVTQKELYHWFAVTEDGAQVRCSNGVLLTPDFSLAEVPAGATTLVCSGTDPYSSGGDSVLNFLRKQAAHGQQLGGICTGAFALAKAGLLRNRRFTLHWENQPAFREHFPDLHPTPTLFEDDKGLWTCGGGHAATDMMLSVIAEEHGDDLAIIVADMCIHRGRARQQSPQKSAHSVAIGSRNRKLLSAITFMRENLENPVSIAEMAAELNLSRRQLERLFRKYLSMSPNQYYADLRVSQAHALLNETDMSVTEIAVATGFSGSTHLSKHFRQKYGAPPHSFRKGWRAPDPT